MTRFTVSQPTRPRFESAPYRPSAARREHIFGRIQGIPDRRDPTARLLRLYALIFALIALWVVVK